jgi:hypothetical protein
MKKTIFAALGLAVLFSCSEDNAWKEPAPVEPQPKIYSVVQGAVVESVNVNDTKETAFEVLLLDKYGEAVPGARMQVSAPDYIKVTSADINTNMFGKINVKVISLINPLTPVKGEITVTALYEGSPQTRLPFETTVPPLYVKDGVSKQSVFTYPEGYQLSANTESELITVTASGNQVTVSTDGKGFDMGENEPIEIAVAANGTTATASVKVFKSDGKPSAPYPIENWADLEAIKNDLDANYIVVRNFELTGGDWTPIYGFKGTLDGDNHTISELTITNASTDNQGLFSYTNGATIRNLHVSGNVTSTADNVSILIGRMYQELIENSSVDGSVIGNKNVGLMVGYMHSESSINATDEPKTVIRYSFVKGFASAAKGYVGGMVGYGYGFTISNSYAVSHVEATDNYAGGLIGYSNAGNLEALYNVSDVYGVDYVGGMFGIHTRDDDGYLNYISRINIFGITGVLNSSKLTAANIFRVGARSSNEANFRYTVRGYCNSSNILICGGISDTIGSPHGQNFSFPINNYDRNFSSIMWDWYVYSRPFRFPILWGRRGTVQDDLAAIDFVN